MEGTDTSYTRGYNRSEGYGANPYSREEEREGYPPPGSTQLPYRYTDHRTPSEASWRKDYFGPQRLGRAPVTFTGPDGLGPHRVAVANERRYVGDTLHEMTWELTSELDYLWRPASATPFPKPKSGFSGSIGWGVGNMNSCNIAFGRNRTPIMLGPFRQAVEDRDTHLGQSPWCEPFKSGFWKTENHLRPHSAPKPGENYSGNNNANHNSYPISYNPYQRQQRFHRYNSGVSPSYQLKPAPKTYPSPKTPQTLVLPFLVGLLNAPR